LVRGPSRRCGRHKCGTPRWPSITSDWERPEQDAGLAELLDIAQTSADTQWLVIFDESQAFRQRYADKMVDGVFRTQVERRAFARLMAFVREGGAKVLEMSHALPALRTVSPHPLRQSVIEVQACVAWSCSAWALREVLKKAVDTPGYRVACASGAGGSSRRRAGCTSPGGRAASCAICEGAAPLQPCTSQRNPRA
jgi:hypothetical protein